VKNISDKQLLKNIYEMAKHHRNLNESLMNDLSRDDFFRQKDRGSYDAYQYVVDMIEKRDIFGSLDYKKIFK
jgi:hypothetical protein